MEVTSGTNVAIGVVLPFTGVLISSHTYMQQSLCPLGWMTAPIHWGIVDSCCCNGCCNGAKAQRAAVWSHSRHSEQNVPMVDLWPSIVDACKIGSSVFHGRRGLMDIWQRNTRSYSSHPLFPCRRDSLVISLAYALVSRSEVLTATYAMKQYSQEAKEGISLSLVWFIAVVWRGIVGCRVDSWFNSLSTTHACQWIGQLGCVGLKNVGPGPMPETR